MKNKLIILILAFTTLSFAFYKMEKFESIYSQEFEYYTSLDKITSSLKSTVGEYKNYKYPQKNCFYHKNIDYIFINDYFDEISFQMINDHSLIQQHFLIKNAQKIPSNDAEKTKFFTDLIKKENNCNLTHLQTKDDSLLSHRIYLSKTEIYSTDSGVTVINKTDEKKVTLQKGNNSVDLQAVLIDYYKNENDNFYSKLSESITNKMAENVVQLGTDIRKNTKILQILKEYTICVLFAIIKDGSDTVLFGTAKNSKEEICWATKIKVDLSTLLRKNFK